MSLLLLLAGAEPAGPSDDRTFDATWEQAAAGWEAVAIKLNADGSWVQNQSWSATATGPGVATPERPSFPVMRVEFGRQLHARFVQPPATWHATMEEDDDELTLRALGVL